MNLWEKLEIRGRDEFQLENVWHMYSADLKDDGTAEIKFAQKHEGKFATGHTVSGFIKYRDLTK